MQQALGHHVLVEFYNCTKERLNDVWHIEQSMNQAALAAGATIVESCFHRFMPHGVSGVVVIAESHLAIHTWPEYGYASVDLYTCGDECNPMAAFEVLKETLGATTAEIQKITRGHMNVIQRQMKDQPAAASQPVYSTAKALEEVV
jgi:S-adenosylmethionine decarboxylase proenzyme